MASVWEELLDAGPVGRESNFFELGGDSLMASRVIGRVRASDTRMLAFSFFLIRKI